MKKVYIMLLLSLAVCTGFAQSNSDTSKHLIFKGVPIDGTLNQYVSRMLKSGFKLIGTNEGMSTLQGDFAGYKECYVGVSTLQKTDLVHKIGVIFPEKDTWSTLSGDYFNLKEMLTEKYGKPSSVVEKFDGSYEQRDDGSKLLAVNLDHCKYYSTWETDKGDIQLSIEHNGLESCFIKLMYFDKINGATIKKQAIDDL